MMLALLLSLAGAAAPNPRAAVLNDDPPVKVWLNHDNYQRGDKARVNVRLSDDGYVIVLRADADGRVRVLFPLDPSDDAFVRGGETIEVRGRGDREAFYVDDREGSGVVLAARSVAPFKFDEFVRGDHWDYRVLSARDAGDDKEAALVDIVQRMTVDGHFDYDAATYGVGSERAYYDSYYPSYSMVHVGFGWGWPYRYGYYSTCYDPFFYDPFVCYDPLFYAPYRYGFTYGYGYGYPYYFRPYGYGYTYTFYRQPRNLFINRVRTGAGFGMTFKDPAGTNRGVGGIGPRFRIPDGTMATRGRSGAAVRERDARQSDAERRASFPVRDRSVRDRGDQPDRGVRDRGDRPARPVDRPAPAAREPERRGDRRGADRPAPERPRDRGSWSAPRSSGGGERGMSSPRGGERSAPANRGGGGGGGGNRGNGGGGGGGGRRRP